MVGFCVTEDAWCASIIRRARLVFMPDREADNLDRPVTKPARKALDRIDNFVSKLRQDPLIMELPRIVLIGYKRWF